MKYKFEKKVALFFPPTLEKVKYTHKEGKKMGLSEVVLPFFFRKALSTVSFLPFFPPGAKKNVYGFKWKCAQARKHA